MISKFKIILSVFLLNISFWVTSYSMDQLIPSIKKLLAAYPKKIEGISEDGIIWYDGSIMSFFVSKDSSIQDDKLNNPTLADQLLQARYEIGKLDKEPSSDPGRIRFEPFFRKMYGNSSDEVRKNLVKVVWMPSIFGDKYILQVTCINNVHEKIHVISEELEELVKIHPEYIKFLENPGGTFNWRFIANTTRLSNHSFGMTIDINSQLSNYWQWDLQKEKRSISEDAELTYKNSIPYEIVEIFEKHGFIWGGKWYHYDTMHFEYRPELMDKD